MNNTNQLENNNKNTIGLSENDHDLSESSSKKPIRNIEDSDFIHEKDHQRKIRDWVSISAIISSLFVLFFSVLYVGQLIDNIKQIDEHNKDAFPYLSLMIGAMIASGTTIIGILAKNAFAPKKSDKDDSITSLPAVSMIKEAVSAFVELFKKK